MKREYVIIANSDGPHFLRIEQAVATVNGLQDYFRCQLVARNDILSCEERFIQSSNLVKKIKKAYGDTPVIALTEEYYKYISEEKLPTHVLVTCADWDDGDQPPLRLFLVYSLASGLLTLESRISDKKNEHMSHDPPIGCIFDWWTDSRILRLDFIAARLCSQCREELEQHLDDAGEALRATEKVLEFVRRVVIGKGASFPAKVWIVHGHGDDWKVLKQVLVELGIEGVDEFNEEQVVGKTIVSRWQEMAGQARFAFALLTRDDRDENLRWMPRLNVAHEIGLCHAHLGLESTAILRERDVTIFSNIQGIVYLDYEPGRLRDKKEQIAALLKSRGVI